MAAVCHRPSERSWFTRNVINRLNWNCWLIYSTFFIFLVFLSTCECAPQIATPLSSEEARDFSIRGLDILTGPHVEETVVEEDITTRQFFEKLGVKRLPTTTEDPISQAPTFMLDLYLELSQTGVVNRSGALRANTVRSFYETETDRGRRNIYEFDISGVLPRERVVAADLRLYKMPPRPDRLSSVDNTSLPSVIQVIQWPDAINSTPGEKQLLDQRFINVDYSGLVTFNVTSAFKSFQAREGDQIQKAFRVKVRDYFEEKYHTKKVVKFAKDPKQEDRRPLLVLFINDSAIPVHDIEVPTRHSDAHHIGKRHVKLSRHELVKRVKRSIGEGRTRTETEPRNKRQPKAKKRGRRTKSTCRLYDFTVDFARLEWQNWIIAPTGYAANFCDGYCPFPLDDPFNATNHATVQVILHERGIKRKGAPLPSPCCVPHEFDSLHVLYLEENNVVLKEFDNMVATACGCH